MHMVVLLIGEEGQCVCSHAGDRAVGGHCRLLPFCRCLHLGAKKVGDAVIGQHRGISDVRGC